MIPPGGSRGSISVIVEVASSVFVPVSVPVSLESEVFVPVALSFPDSFSVFPVSVAVSADAVGLASLVSVVLSSSERKKQGC